MSADRQSVERQLDWERRWGPFAAAAAVAAVVLQIAGWAVLGTIPSHPRTPGAVLDLPAFLVANATALIVAALLGAAGLLATIAPFDFLYRATKFRRPQLPGFARLTVYAGPVLAGLGQFVLQLVLNADASEYVARGGGDYFAARRVGSDGSTEALFFAKELGRVSLVFAFVIVPLNAMRAGLLTRFMGTLGIIVGVAFVLLPTAPILSWFWLGALAYLLLGRWPGGTPPAWHSGSAEPWPSAKELRAAREAGRAPAEEKPEAVGPAADHPSRPRSRKRRGRKRR